MKLFHKIYVCMFFLFFLCIGVFLLVKKQDDYSKNENRYLEKLPAFSVEAYLGGEYQKGLEKALTDQFPARDVLTGMSTAIRSLAGLHDVGDVYLGRDHFYLDKKLEKDISFSQYEKNLRSVKKFSEKLSAHAQSAAGESADAGAKASEFTDVGAPSVRVMLVPSPASIMPDKLPMYAKIYDDEPYFDKAAEMFGDDFIDVRGALMSTYADEAPYQVDTNSSGGGDKSGSNLFKGNEGLYFRTDHHWTDLGAYTAYREFQKAMGHKIIDRADFNYRIVSDDFYGTMFSRALDMGAVSDTIRIPGLVGTTDKIADTPFSDRVSGVRDISDKIRVTTGGRDIPFYDMDKLKTKDQYAVYMGGNYPSVEIENKSSDMVTSDETTPKDAEAGSKNEVQTGRTLLIFKDSFANSFVPMIINDYAKIVMIDLRYETRPMNTILEEYSPDEVLVLYELSNFADSSEVARLSIISAG